MARYSFQGTFRDGQGNVLSGGRVVAYLAGTTTVATIYADDTTIDASTYIESDSNGYFIFYIDSSDYDSGQLFDIELSKATYSTKTYPDVRVMPVVTDQTIEVTDNTENNVTDSAHGWAPKLSGSATDFLDGTGNWDAVSDSDLEITDVTTNNASTSAHGFLKKLDNEATHFMDGAGNWDTVKDSDLALTDITDNDVSTTKHGFVPKLPDDPAKFLNGTGNWTTPSGGGGGGSARQTVLSSKISSGLPTFITDPNDGLKVGIDTDTGDSPIIVSFSAGFDANGPVEHVGSISDDTEISGLSDNSTNYLYAERNSETGAVTLGKTTVMPVYDYSAPSHASGKYWFCIPAMKMYLSNGSDTWTEKQVVFLGEAVCSGGQVTSVVNYALRGEYISGITTPLPGAASNFSKNHNIGVIPDNAVVEFVCLTPEHGYTVGMVARNITAYGSTGSWYGSPMTLALSKTLCSACTGEIYTTVQSRTTAQMVSPTTTNWGYRFKMRRGW